MIHLPGSRPLTQINADKKYEGLLTFLWVS
jgi:hypothetical protein